VRGSESESEDKQEDGRKRAETRGEVSVKARETENLTDR